MIWLDLQLLFFFGSQPLDELLDPVAEEFADHDLAVVQIGHLKVSLEVAPSVSPDVGCSFLGISCCSLGDGF